MSNWTELHAPVLTRAAIHASGLLPFKKPGYNVTPFILFVTLDVDASGKFSVVNAERKATEEVAALHPMAKVGLQGIMKDTRRSSSCRGVAIMILKCDGMNHVRPTAMHEVMYPIDGVERVNRTELLQSSTQKPLV
jgi:hypothetical protein